MPSPDLAVDVTPWNGWRAPTIAASATTDLEDIGPVLVTVEYDIAPARASDFIKVMRRYGRIRRRDGAYEWGIFRDAEKENCYLETFLVHSWAEHLRQHARSIRVGPSVGGAARPKLHAKRAQGPAPHLRKIMEQSFHWVGGR